MVAGPTTLPPIRSTDVRRPTSVSSGSCPSRMQLLVYGSGGFGTEVVDMARRMNRATPRWAGIEFIDDIRPADTHYGIPVRPRAAALSHWPPGEREVVIAVGQPSSRQRLREELEALDVVFGQVIDPSAVVSDTAVLGRGVVIAPHAIVASLARLDDNVVLNAKAIVGHDVRIGRDTVISSMVNVGGASTVGACSYIGMGAQIKEKRAIGDRTIIGMGSVLHDNVGDDLIAMGSPARPVRRNEDNVVFR